LKKLILLHNIHKQNDGRYEGLGSFFIAEEMYNLNTETEEPVTRDPISS